MSVKLTQNCTEIQMGVSQCLGAVKFEFQFKCFNEIGKGGSDLTSSSIIASQVIIGGGFQGNGVSGYKFCLSEIIESEFKVLFLKMNHGSQIEILTQFFRSSGIFRMLHTIYIFLNGDDFFHDVNTLNIFAIFL